jgi:adenylate cyclase
MNTASRLEAANKALDSSVMASQEFADRSGLDWWRPMGRGGAARAQQAGRPVRAGARFPREDRAVTPPSDDPDRVRPCGGARGASGLIERIPDSMAPGQPARTHAQPFRDHAFVLG